MNYRKKYEELLNLILSNKEEIHHLDMDRENEIKKYIKKRNSLLLEVI